MSVALCRMSLRQSPIGRMPACPFRTCFASSRYGRSRPASMMSAILSVLPALVAIMISSLHQMIAAWRPVMFSCSIPAASGTVIFQILTAILPLAMPAMAHMQHIKRCMMQPMPRWRLQDRASPQPISTGQWMQCCGRTMTVEAAVMMLAAMVMGLASS